MVAFDLLYLNGYDLLKLPLFERKALLKKIVFETDIQSSESFEIDGREMYKHACKTGLEGVVSKVRDSRYVSGRVNDWVKKTCAQRETLAIAGFALDGGKWDGLYLGGYHLIEMLRQSLFGLPDTGMSTTRAGSVGYPMPVGLRNNLRLSGYFALLGRLEAEQACLDTFVCSAPRTGGAANFPQSIMMVHIVSFWISYNNLL